MAIPLNDNVEVFAPKPSDPRFLRPDNSVWTSVAEVNSTIPLTRRYPGLPVNINNVIYRYKTGIQDSDLVIDNPNSVVVQVDRFLTLGTYTLTPEAGFVRYIFTDNVGVNYSWIINEVLYQNIFSEIYVFFAATGFKRFDMFYTDNTDGIKIRLGDEVLIAGQAVLPPLNPGELLIGYIEVTDNTTGTLPPISTEDFMFRSMLSPLDIEIPSDGLIDISLYQGGQTNFKVFNNENSINGFIHVDTDFDGNHIEERAKFYPGKIIIIDNQSTSNLTVNHSNNDAEVKFIFNNETNLVIPTKEKIICIVNNGYALELYAKSWDNNLTPTQESELQNAYNHSQATGNPHNTQYSDLGGIPSSFTPSAHTHTLSQITDAGALASLNSVGESQIDNQAVTNTKLANMNANTLKGRSSGNGAPQDVTMASLPISTATQAALNTKQNNATYITANRTAVNNARYIANGTFTITDIASPVAGSNYEVTVVNGTVTIGGTAYTEGMIVTRTFHSGSWRSKAYVDLSIINTSLNTKENTITAGTTAQYFRGDKTFQNVIDLPISTATQTALDTKVDKAYIPLTLTGNINVSTLEQNRVYVVDLDGADRTISIDEPTNILFIIASANTLFFDEAGTQTLTALNDDLNVAGIGNSMLIENLGTNENFASKKGFTQINPEDYPLNLFPQPTTQRFLRDGIDSKAGIITSGFTGSPLIFDVVFSDFGTTDYTIQICGVDSRQWSYSLKTATGFRIHTNSSTALTGEVSWRADKI